MKDGSFPIIVRNGYTLLLVIVFSSVLGNQLNENESVCDEANVQLNLKLFLSFTFYQPGLWENQIQNICQTDEKCVFSSKIAKLLYISY